MIISVERAAAYIGRDIPTDKLELWLNATEVAIRKYTNNNFHKKGMWFYSSTDQIKSPIANWLKIGDTLQVSQSQVNNGLYTINSINGDILTLNEPIYSEDKVLFVKIEYPADVELGVLEMLRWKTQNEDQNYNPEAEKPVQSESISRHSVTYAKDATEEQLDARFGVPSKYTAFLKRYMKARF